jgi:protein-disulfide isomerase
MHDAIYNASTGPSEDTGKYSIANLEIIAQGVSGLNTAKFNSCLESNSTLSQVQQVMTQTQQAGFQIATPQFFVNGKSVQPSWSAIQTAINAA